MSVLMRRENTLIIEPGSDISKIQIINFILLPNSKKHFEGPPLYYLMTITPKKPMQLLSNPLINPYLSYTSSVHDCNQLFGIEAARQLILDEVYTLYKDYGMNVCHYHVQILSSFMTVTGQVLGYTNQGLKQVKKNKTILLVSFERTGEYLFQAGIQGIQEKFNEVSEDLIFGNCFQIGSGGVGLQWGDFETEAETGRKWE
ncbi:DNA-directed_RNA polymerase subunit [Hexamita inflata]|uniref:DNA-directed RNA polymerase n=1 Tax=Hexamita inflata TaxID=28002 RepID=A0AA86PFK2_9EUKA|nr:DNA-directed RNA polymerase subunit [Hexamita inflata]